MPTPPPDFKRLQPFDAGAPASERASRATVRGERVEEGRIDLAPRGAGRILDLGLDLVRSRFALYAGLASLVWFPARALQPFLGQHRWMNAANPMPDTSAVLGSLFGLGLTLGATLVVQVIASALVALLVQADLLGEPRSARDALASAVRRLPGLFLIAIVIGMMQMVGLCLLILPYFLVLWMTSLAPIVYILENSTVGASVQRSIELTAGGWPSSLLGFLRWAAIMIGIQVLVLPLTTTGALADNAAVRQSLLEGLSMSGSVFDLVLLLVSSVFFGVATAAVTTVIVAFYFDCRARREGFDLVRRLDALRALRGSSGVGDSTAPGDIEVRP